jgi:hypothetical protein
MRFWIYFKGNNNGELLVGYRYTPQSDIQPLTFSNYQSCQTNTTQCSWQRIDVSLSSILTKSTEVKKPKKKRFVFKYFSYFIQIDYYWCKNWC